jgi:hypothetical protein
MPTFMTHSIFRSLAIVRQKLAKETLQGAIGPSHIFVPWAGERLISTGRGIYYVGIATNAEEAGTDEPEFEATVSGTERYCRSPKHGHTPYWRFLDRLTREMLGGPFDRTQDRWGWSNLLKVAGTQGSPNSWPPTLISGQRDVCVAAFREEVVRLKQSLIVVTSEKDYGILHEVAGDRELWDTTPRKSQIYFRHDSVSGTLFVHTHHPNYLQRKVFFDDAVADTILVARKVLAPF